MWLLCNILSHVVTDILAQSSCQKPTIPKNITLFLWWIARIFIPLYPQIRMGPHFFMPHFDFVRWFGSSVGLEQQPSKLRVKGSSPFRITRTQINIHQESSAMNSLFLSSALKRQYRVSGYFRLVDNHNQE